SDTGAGSSLKEFQDLKYTHNRLSAVEWDGMLSITTTSIGDADIFHYDLNLKESSASRRLTKLPSSSKKNAIFSGTEVSLSTAEDIELLFADITAYLKKMLILKICVSLSPVCFSCNAIRMVLVLLQKVYLEVRVHAEPLAFGFVMLHQNIAVELVDEFGDQQGLRSENVAFSTELTLPSADSSNLERLASGLEEHVFKHGDGSEKCQSCFLERDSVKVGCGRACVKENLNGTLVVEAVMIISESSEPSSPSCLKAFEPKTERTKVETKLMKEAIRLALDDLKERYSGALLSAHAVKINTYAPDLARSITGLILSSDDPNFQGECLGLLGMQMGNIEGESVEECIKQKILSAIDINDRRPPSLKRNEDIPFLFGVEHYDEPENMWHDYEGEEEGCTMMDF
ncbi:hypothetical protein KSS87_002865, partial [Heliosperma pusillum]